jgi:hypothetical protein
VLGNVTISLIACGLALISLLIFRVPFPLLLAVLVALLDVIPVVGTTIAGVGVTLVALTVSGPVALATGGYLLVYRLSRTTCSCRTSSGAVKVPGLLTVVAVLLGGVLPGESAAVTQRTASPRSGVRPTRCGQGRPAHACGEPRRGALFVTLILLRSLIDAERRA